jgi:pyruvate kinase
VPRTKIVCTIGPASESADTIAALLDAGMDVARLNFSHGSQQKHAAAMAAIRQEAARRGRPVAILQDLAGVKVRVGPIASGSVLLTPESLFTLTTRPVPGDAREVSLTYAGLPGSVRPGDSLLLADGELKLEVLSANPEEILCRVVVGGRLSSNKGINLPDRSIAAPSLTDKDRDDLLFGVAQGVDYLALSFVRSAEDLREARRLLAETKSGIPIIAKIEKHEALASIDEILAAADGIMVARGDLGVETPLEHVPVLQKMLIRKANRAGKPVITATQMLRSMVESPRPTRAEVADVANAILDGTDAVMLSEETAVGRYAVEATATMARIAQDTETALPFENWEERLAESGVQPLPEAVAGAACALAEDINAAAIVAYTQLGSTARLVAKHRPRRPIVALSPLEATCRRLSLVWGVVPLRTESAVSTDEMLERAPSLAARTGFVRSGDRVVITAGVQKGVTGSTDLIKAAVAP